jgi:hypothetical protein
LPGVYINLTTVPRPLGVASDRGYGTFAKALSWGPEGAVVTIENGEDTFAKLGYSILDPQMLHIREFFKGSNTTSAPRTLYLYRLPATGGASASVAIDTLTITARYNGVRGNDIIAAVSNDVDDPDKFIVTTIVDGATRDVQSVAVIGDLTDNDWVTFSGSASDAPTANVGTYLAGGSDGTIPNASHVSYLTAVETMLFNSIAYLGTDPLVKSMYAAFAKRLRNEYGRYFECFMADYASADSETVVSVFNGVALDTGETLANTDCVAWFAGASAGANNNQSLTYAAYPGATDAAPKLTRTELTNAVQSGNIAFFEEYGQTKVCRDVNTLTTFTPYHGKSFGKNRVMRVLDSIANDSYMIFSQYYIGKADNNEFGRGLLKAELVKYVNDLQANNAVQNFSSDDLTVLPGDDVDAVVINLCVQPVDTIEKIYITVIVS